jgi:acyl-CoA synthetase (AMP-forming)/AMP-acid ligase II
MTTSTPPDSVRTVKDAVEQKADALGDQPFLQYGDRTLTYAELDRRVNVIANSLRSRGVEPGETVCLYLYTAAEYVVTYLALAKLGAVVAPIDTRFSGETLAFVLRKSDASTIFVDADTHDAYQRVRSEVPNITAEYYVGGQAPIRSYREFATLAQHEDTTAPSVDVAEADTLSVTFIQRHATEQPKGVLLPHYSYINTGWETCENLFGFSSSDRVFTTLPLYSIFTFQLGVMGSLLGEAQVIVSDPFDPDTYWDLVEQYDATIILYLGRMLSVLYNQEAGPPEGASRVDLAIGHGFGFGTDETLIENFEERFDITVLEGYGITQTGTLATYNTPEDRTIGSSGKPVSFAEVQIVDENDWPVPTGESGEIVVRPTRPNTMLQGYYDDPEGAVDLCRNQWIHSGDIGYMDADGCLHFVANRDNSIYRGSIAGRISSLEIESVVTGLPGVRESAVVGVDSESGNEAIKVTVVPAADADLDPADVCRHCERNLPYLKVPRYIEIQSELPRNPSGKIKKDELRTADRNDAWDRRSGYELSR